MKRVFKRWMAMLLAVLMVVGTLPTTAWAAHIEDDPLPAVPATGQKDDSADTLGRWDDDDDPLPIDPVDPSPGPVDPNWSKWTIEVTTLTSDGHFEVTVSANGEGDTGSASTGNMAFILVPNLKAETEERTPEEMINVNITTNTVGGGKMESAVSSYAGLADGMYYTSVEQFTMPATGKATLEGNLPDYNTLAEALLGIKAVDKTGTAWKKGDSIPMVAILVTQGGTIGITWDNKATYGGGVPSAEYVINLNGGSIQKIEDGNLVNPPDGTKVFNGTNIDIALPNFSGSALYVGFPGGNGNMPTQAQITSDTSYANFRTGVLLADQGIAGNSSGTLYLNLAKEEPGTISVQLPLYNSSNPETTDRPVTATITIHVIKSDLGAVVSPIVFDITSGENFGTLEKEIRVSYAKSDPRVSRLFVYPDVDEDTSKPISGQYDGAIGTFSQNYGLSIDGGTELMEEGDGGWPYKPIVIYGADDTITYCMKVKLTYQAGVTPSEVGAYPAEATITGASEDGEYAEDGENIEWGYMSGNITVPVIINVKEAPSVFKCDYFLKYVYTGVNVGDVGNKPSDQTALDQKMTPYTGFSVGAEVPTLAGYTFSHWEGDDGKNYNPGDALSIDGVANGSVTRTLTAVWTKNYSLTYAEAGATYPQLGDDLPAATTAAADGSVTVSTDVTTNPVTEKTVASGAYYKFAGWSDGTDTHAPGAKITIAEDTKLTAVWDKSLVTVTYQDSTPGHASASSQIPAKVTDHHKGTDFGVSSSTPTGATGYSFNHWSGSDGKTYGVSGTVEKLAADLTLTAVWDRDQSSVRFDANGGTFPDGTTNITVSGNTGETTTERPSNDPYYGSSTNPTRDFVGWSETTTGPVVTTVTFHDEAGKTKPYYARWETTLTYNINLPGDKMTSSTAPAANTGVTGRMVSFDDPTAIDLGNYVFGGWAASKGDAATGAAITDQKITSLDEHTTVYAIWSAKKGAAKITVQLDTTGKRTGLANSIKLKTTAGDAVTATFTAGSTGNDANVYTSEETLDDGTYKIFINDKDTNVTVTVPKGGTGTATVDYYNIGVSVNPAGSGHATMKYTEPGQAQQTVNDSGSAIVVKTTKVEWEYGAAETHYEKGNWGGLTHNNKITNDGVTEPKSYIANFVKVKYNVTFKPNGGNDLGEGGAADKTVKVEAEKTTTPPSSTEATRTGYTLAGWNTAANGSGDAFTASTKVESDITVYAQWTANKYTVTWNGNGGTWDDGTASQKTNQYTYGTQINAAYSPAPTQQYYDLLGWYKEGDDSQTVIDFTNAPVDVPANNDLVFVAKWKLKKSDVVINFMKTDVGDTAAAYAVDGTVKLVNGGTTYTGSTTGAQTSVTISDVPQGTTTYKILFEDTDTTATVTVNADTADLDPVVVNFYEMQAKSDGKGTATVALGDAGYAVGAASASATNATPQSIIVLKGSKVNWTSANSVSNWVFDYWDTAGNKNAPTIASASEPASHTANFVQNSFNTQLVVELNGKALTGTTVGAGKDVTAVTANAGTVTFESGHWVTKGVSKGTTVTWTVSTISGDFTVTGNGDDSRDDYTPKKEELFSVKVVDGAGNDATHKPFIDTVGTDRAIMERGSKVLTDNHADGYTLTGWVNNAGGALPTGASMGTGADLSKLTLADTYKPTDGADLVLKPTYTFEATVETHHKTVTGSLVATTVVLKEEGATAAATGVTVTKVADGKYTVKGLLPEKTYDIWVNGFKVGEGNKQIAAANADGTVAVIVFKVTATQTPPAGSTLKVGLNAANATEAVIPNGAKVTTDAPTVNASATVPGGYRKRTVAVDGAGNTFWTADGGTVTAADGDTTTWTIEKMTADVELTAHFVLQRRATVITSGTKNDASTDAKYTAVTGAGSAIDSAGSTKDHAATVDDGGYLTATFNAGTGDALNGWTFEKGELYKTLTGTTLSDPLDATAAASYTGETVYFKPTETGAKLTAKVTPRKYTISVTVNEDNDELTDGIAVQVKNGAGDVTPLSYDATNKWHADVLPGTYTVWTNVANGKGAAATQTAVKTIEFEPKHGELDHGNYNAEKLKAVVNYYTVVLKTNVTKGTANAGNTVRFGSETAGAEVEKILLAKDGAYDITPKIQATPHNDDTAGKHYKFTGWTVSHPTTDGGTIKTAATSNPATYELPAENKLTAKSEGNFIIDKDHKITITANFVQFYKVTVQRSASLPSDIGTNVRAYVRTSDSANDNDWGVSTVDVDAGDPVYLKMQGSHIDYVFADWTPNSGAGTFNKGVTGVESTTQGTVKPADGRNTFTPTEDSVLDLNLWKKATLAAGWKWDPVDSSKHVDGNAPAGELKWTKNGGSDPVLSNGVKLEKLTSNTDDTVVDTITLTDGDLVQDGTDKTKYTFKSAFLNDRTNGRYRVTFTYKLGPDGHKNQEVLTVYADFFVDATVLQLTETMIRVKAAAGTTANPTASTSRDAVEYLSHKDTKVDHGELAFTWYYADVIPTTGNAGKAYDDKTKAEAALTGLAGLQKIGDTAGSNGVSGWTGGTDSIATGTVAVTSAMAGKYIFAVVNTTNAERAKGAVITNAIAVDFDGKVLVKEDGNAITADYDHYSVYLWPSDGGTFDKDDDKAIPATHADGDAAGTYSTKNSALINGKTYHVYVQEVESNTTKYVQHKTGSNATTITVGNRPTAPVVDYYTVTLTDLGKKGWAAANSTTHPYLEHFKDAGNQEVGEAWDYANMPGVKAETAVNHIAVTSGTAVLKNTTVKATAKPLSAPNADKAWLQDYDLDWYTDVAVQNTLAKGTLNQTSATAVTAGHTTAAITHATEITGLLKQKTYKVVGDINGSGQIEHDPNKSVPTLTYQNGEATYTFKGAVQNPGGNSNTVTFTVPRSGVADGGAITGSYTLTATPKANPQTTLLGYSVPAETALPATQSRTVAVNTAANGATKSEQFTIFIAAATIKLTVSDNGDTAHTHPGTDGWSDAEGNNFKENTGRHVEGKTFANYSGGYTRIITVTRENDTNTDVKVTPTLEKWVYDETNGWQKDTAFSPAENTTAKTLTDNLGDATTAKNIVISNWEPDGVVLTEANKAYSVTVTVPDNLEVKDKVRYRFVFTGKDAREGFSAPAPLLWFEFEPQTKPVTVAKVKTTHPGGDLHKYEVDKVWIEEDGLNDGDENNTSGSYGQLKKPIDNPGSAPSPNNDLVYEWYAAEWDDVVTFEGGKLKANGTAMTLLTAGVSADTRTFDLDQNPAAMGKTLYMLVKGQNNATGAATTPDVISEEPEPPMMLPYSVNITVAEDTTPIAASEKDKYEVYLWNTTADGPFDPTALATKAIKATWVDGSPGYYKANGLYASDPIDPTNTAKYEYQVWTNTVKDNMTQWKHSGATVSIDDYAPVTVTYHSLTLAKTTYTNGIYDGKLTGDQFFTNVNQKTGITPTATAQGVTVATDEDNKWVQKGTEIALAEAAWNKDYSLAWTNAAKQGTDAATGGSAAKIANLNASTTVTTELTLRLYDVRGTVDGPGKLDWIKMTLDDNHVFATLADDTTNHIFNATSGVPAEIKGGYDGTFKVPAGTYTISENAAAGVTVADHLVPINGASTTTIVVNATQQEADQLSFVIKLMGDGLSLKVTDGTRSSTAGYNDGAGQDGAPIDNTVNIFYGYTGEVSVPITLTNTSKDGATVYHVRATPALTGNSSEITFTSADFGNDAATVKATMSGTDSFSAKLTLDAGLGVGTYKYVVDFGFSGTEDNTTTADAKVTYTYTVNVNPVELTAVTTDKDNQVVALSGTAAYATYTTTPSVTLTAGTDFTYQWVRGTTNGTKPTVTWNNADGSITVTDGAAISGATNNTYTMAAADEGKEIYLVISSVANGKSTGAAISDPIKVGYQGVVKITEDGNPVTTQPAPAYEVKFIPADGGAAISGTWNNAKGGYIADLDPTVASYGVEVGRFKGDTTTVTLTGETITNDDREATAPYFTVTAKPFAQKDHITNTTGETFTDAEKQFTMKVGTATLTSPTPVLSGQFVNATAAPGAHDYTLMWQSANATTNVSAEATTADTGTTGDTYSQKIEATTFLGGRLDQNTYTVSGKIVGPTTATVKKAELAFAPAAGDGRTFTYTTDTTAGQLFTGLIDNTNSDGLTGNKDDTITFKVVKGSYNITAYDGDNTTIQKVTVGGEDDPVLTTESPAGSARNKNKLGGGVPTGNAEVAEDGRIFTVYTADTALTLNVTDDEAPTANAGSSSGSGTDATNKHHAYNEEVHYFHAVSGAFELTLENKGNTDLTLSQPKVYVVNSGAIDATTVMSTVTLGTAKTLTGSGWSDSNVTISDLVAANTALAVDATAKGGAIALNATAAAKDDKIYVIEFASNHTAGNGGEGPTVYYVLDLTVNPLPIVGVDAARSNDATGELSLVGAATATGGLDHVWIDHDGDNDPNDYEAANDVGLVDGDFSFVWAVSDDGGLVRGDFTLDTTANKITSAKATVDSTLGKTRTPQPDEEGKYFYLIAYRVNDNSNAADFAVSEGVYAQVTVGLKALQTGETDFTNALDAVQIHGTLGEGTTPAHSNGDKLIIKGKDAADAGISFTADLNDFVKADTTATDDPSKATYYFHHWAAKLQNGDWIDFTDASITPDGVNRLLMNYLVSGQADVVGYYDLLPELKEDKGYNVGGAAYENGADLTNELKARTITYTHHDGSGQGKVTIEIKPVTGDTFKNGDTEPLIVQIPANVFDTVGGDAAEVGTGNVGKDGKYVLKKQWILDNLVEDKSYTITFYDLEKGQYSAVTAETKTEREGGYAGYDRSITYDIVGAEKTVKAQVKNDGTDDAPVYHGKVQVKKGTPPDGALDLTSTQNTAAGWVTLYAEAEEGYVFQEWTLITTDGGTFENDNRNLAEVRFKAAAPTVTVEASFRKAKFEVPDGITASVYYGDDTFWAVDANGNPIDNASVTVETTPETGVTTQEFEYALATEDEIKAELGGVASLADNIYYQVADGVTDAHKIPTWLKLGTEGTGHEAKAKFSVDGSATGVNVRKDLVASPDQWEDKADELVVYLKVTEKKTGEVKFVPVTVDVMTSELKIITDNTNDSATQPDKDGEAYVNRFKVAKDDTTYYGEGEIPDHDGQVYLDYFAYVDVQNVHNSGNKVDEDNHGAHAAGAERWNKTPGATNTGYGKVTDGTWEVEPGRFDGTGENEYIQPGEDGHPATNANIYTFTYSYTGSAADGSDQWNYKSAKITLKIPAKVPEMSLKFSDALQTETAGGDPKTLTLTKGTHSEAEGADVTAGGAPVTLAGSKEASRKEAHLTYLDEEPVFRVTLHKVGNLAKVELTKADVDGFAVDLPTVTLDPAQTTQDVTFDVRLSELAGPESGRWAGPHTITITAKGYPDADDQTKFIEATYELEIIMDEKTINSIDVSTANDKTTVTGTIDTDTVVDDETPDKHGNTPIKPGTTVTETEENGEVVKREVSVTIDPNYIYVKTDDPENEPEKEITNNTELDGKGNDDDNVTVKRDENDGDHTVHITEKVPVLMHYDVIPGEGEAEPTVGTPAKKYTASKSIATNGKVENRTIHLGAYGSDVYDVTWTVEQDDLTGEESKIKAVLKDAAGNEYTWNEAIELINEGATTDFVLDFTAATTTAPGTYSFALKAVGEAHDGETKQAILSTYTFTLNIRNNNPPSPPPEVCPCKVFYHIGPNGTTEDPTVEDVAEKYRPSQVPAVTALDGYVFRGWSLTNPATLKPGELPQLVDPKTVEPKGEETVIFYAVIQQRAHHEHYVIGYPNGNFGPADDITRGSVATIIARAILPDFVEGSNYGNPGHYGDVTGHWAESAIAYCTKFGVFNGYDDGNFYPDKPITRQEFALVIARLDGVMTPGEMDFTDIDQASAWALGGIYTAYYKGWVNGYPDGTFKPLNNIRRDEAVKIFNAYLHRGVDADGLRDLHPYVHTGAAGNNTGNGVDEYMTWPDVPQGHWAYYEIIEAANDHEYTAEMDGSYTVPEYWETCGISQRWRYGADPGAGAVAAGFQVWLH